MANTLDETVSALKAYFSGQPKVRLAWLFGSVANGRAMLDSDVDVAVWFDEGYTFADIARLQGDLESLLQRSVDVVALNDANPLVALEAVNGLAVWAVSEREQIDRMMQIWRAADDWRQFIDEILTVRRRSRERARS